MRDTGRTKYKRINHWLMLDLIGRTIQRSSEPPCEERDEVRVFEEWLKAASAVLATLNAG